MIKRKDISSHTSQVPIRYVSDGGVGVTSPPKASVSPHEVDTRPWSGEGSVIIIIIPIEDLYYYHQNVVLPAS